MRLQRRGGSVVCHFIRKRILMKLKALLSLLLLPLSALSAEFYVDSAVGTSGDGSLASPWKALANVNWSGVQAALNVGDVHLNLKRGSAFREQLVVNAAGSNTLTIQAYGTGRPPQIRGDDPWTQWSSYPAGAGSTWSVNITGPDSAVFLQGVNCTRGASPSTLGDGQYFQSGSTLYLRWDAGNPDELGLAVEKISRITPLSLTARSNVVLQGLSVLRGADVSASLASCRNVTIRNCILEQSASLLRLSDSSAITIQSCTFSNALSTQGILVQGPLSQFRLAYCLFVNNPIGLWVTGGGAESSCVNCTFVAGGTRHVYNNSPLANLSLVNCIFSGNGMSPFAVGNAAVTSTAGAVTVTNCIALLNGKNLLWPFEGVSTSGIILDDPQYTAARGPSILGLMVDDTPNIHSWLILADLAERYGFRATFGVNTRPPLEPTAGQWAALRAKVALGHAVSSHSQRHPDLTISNAFRIQYLGLGSACTLSITASNLTTTVTDGLPTDQLNISLLQADTISKVVLMVRASGPYTCTAFDSLGISTPSAYFTPVTDVDIKSAPFIEPYDYALFLTNEIFGSFWDIQTNIPGYTPISLTYPGGSHNDTIISFATNAGYLGARGTLTPPAGGYKLNLTNNVYRLGTAGPFKGEIQLISFENSVGDGSPQRLNFTPRNLAFARSNANTFQGTTSGYFDGNSTYLSRASNTNFDFSLGDWHVAAYCAPIGSGSRTIYFHGNDANNYTRFWIDGDRAVRLRVLQNGAPIVDLASASGIITNNQVALVSAMEERDLWMLRVNTFTVASTNTTARPTAYSGDIYIGCAYDFSAGTNSDYYAGCLDDFSASRFTYLNTISICDYVSEDAAVMTLYTHTGALSIWQMVCDALRDYRARNARLAVSTLDDAIRYIRNSGTSTDGIVWTARPSAITGPNYMPQATSPARRGAVLESTTGFANLVDVNGKQITDTNGVPLRSAATIGAYEHWSGRLSGASFLSGF
jgi:hypothetical protein